MPDDARMAGLEQRLNEAEAKHLQAVATIIETSTNVKALSARVDQVVAALTANAPRTPSETVLLKNYEIHSEQIIGYQDLLVKMSGWYVGVTTATVGFCLAKPGEVVRYVLVLPTVLTIGLLYILFRAGIPGSTHTHEEMGRLSAALGLIVTPDARVLKASVYLNIVILSIALLGLVALFFVLPHLPPLTLHS